MAASASKKASNTPALLKRLKPFHTLFQGPKRSGNARQRTFSTVKTHVFNGEEMQSFEEQTVVVALARSCGRDAASRRETPPARAPNLLHPFSSTWRAASDSLGTL